MQRRWCLLRVNRVKLVFKERLVEREPLVASESLERRADRVPTVLRVAWELQVRQVQTEQLAVLVLMELLERLVALVQMG